MVVQMKVADLVIFFPHDEKYLKQPDGVIVKTTAITSKLRNTISPRARIEHRSDFTVSTNSVSFDM
jgi:hypothetical protein